MWHCVFWLQPQREISYLKKTMKDQVSTYHIASQLVSTVHNGGRSALICRFAVSGVHRHYMPSIGRLRAIPHVPYK